MGRLAAALAAAGAVLLTLALLAALASFNVAAEAVGVGFGGTVGLLGAALGLAVATLFWLIGNVLYGLSLAKTRGESSKLIGAACIYSAANHGAFTAAFLDFQDWRLQGSSLLVAVAALILAVLYLIVGVRKIK